MPVPPPSWKQYSEFLEEISLACFLSLWFVWDRLHFFNISQATLSSHLGHGDWFGDGCVTSDGPIRVNFRILPWNFTDPGIQASWDIDAFSPLDVNEKASLIRLCWQHEGVIFRVHSLEQAERKDQEKPGPW